jgi:hypothetical protein
VTSPQLQINSKAADESKKAKIGPEVRLQTRAPMTVRMKFVASEADPKAIKDTLQAAD